MNRRERRARERRDRKQPVIITGEGIVATELPGHTYEARPAAKLPAKVLGQHRWIATASWVLSDVDAKHAMDSDTPKFMDHENLHAIGIGCWDCEQPLGAIDVDSVCPAPLEACEQ